MNISLEFVMTKIFPVFWRIPRLSCGRTSAPSDPTSLTALSLTLEIFIRMNQSVYAQKVIDKFAPLMGNLTKIRKTPLANPHHSFYIDNQSAEDLSMNPVYHEAYIREV
jgi:hypothetical protein